MKGWVSHEKKIVLVCLTFFLLIQLFFFSKSIYLQKNPAVVAGIADTELTTSDIAANTDPLDSVTDEDTKTSSDFVFQANPYSEYYEQNSDYVGWLTFDSTRIDYPVVRGQDNAYYLKHNFYKEKDILGSIFMDYRNIGMGKDKHTILYGHYSKYGHMFADLEQLLDLTFLEDNSTFTFKDPYTNRQYAIFSIHVSPAESEYIPVHFEENEFDEFISSLKDKSVHPLDVSVTAKDRILTLVTCNYGIENGRLYVNAVEVVEE